MLFRGEESGEVTITLSLSEARKAIGNSTGLVWGPNDHTALIDAYVHAYAQSRIGRVVSRKDDSSSSSWHEFQGRLDRDCELCGKPDRHPNHNPEGKFNG